MTAWVHAARRLVLLQFSTISELTRPKSSLHRQTKETVIAGEDVSVLAVRLDIFNA